MLGLPDIRNYVILALVVSCAVLGLSTCEYRRQFKAADFALEVQNQAIQAQKDLVNKKLLLLTKQRDEEYLLREEVDKNAKSQITHLQRQLDAVPISVRYSTQGGDAGCGGGSAAKESTDAGAGHAGAATGVLPEANSRRLKRALKEIEELSTAYTSCRAQLVKEE